MTNCVVSKPKNWISYLLDSLVNTGSLPSWEALEYLTSNLLGDSPNQQLHNSKSPYEAIQQLLYRVYGPITEAASRSIDLPDNAMLHMFTDISLIGKSAVLVVYFPGKNQPHQLLLLDSAQAWELVFESDTAFNHWADERYQWITQALQSLINEPTHIPTTPEEPTLAEIS